MANTALFGDNHGMFHQVGADRPVRRGHPTGDAERHARAGRRRERRRATGPSTDHGEVCYRAPLDAFRVSVLWKADVYATAAERNRSKADTLSLDDVADVFNDDLARRGSAVRFDPTRAEDLTLKAEMATVYPEAVPVGRLVSAFG